MSEDMQMVLEMFKEWQKGMPKVLIAEGVKPTFRGIPIRWLMQQTVRQDGKAEVKG